ncbi:AraC family transcriptional regulator [Belnapia sp. T18]|uniref:AraC family transcriptional regulator n=1 Tax=Belnapia arida TaxID=2804533 RepID=A0ABS1U4J9_9PROT|nr:AraC family transcriptional regulator [Belnapia arida]MBL6078652.1 AraC family transcriptional regulator [Belnapia arida]
MDPLSDVLRSVRLTGGLFVEAHFTAPWCVTAQVPPGLWAELLAAPYHLIAYHVVLEGEMRVGLAEAPDFLVRAGEVVLFPRNDGHALSSGPGLLPVRAEALLRPAAGGGLARIRHGGGGAATHLVCGFLGSEGAANPLIASLPPVLRLDLRQGAAWGWVEASVRFAAAELAAGRLPTSDVVSRLSETLLLEAMRRHLAAPGPVGPGWLRGLGDPCIGRALGLIHGDITLRWSVAGLARAVGMSRSAFVERFSALLGMPPMRYLAAWRLHRAGQQLREGGRTVGQVTHAVGYASEEAFSRAFKRQYGLSPREWRQQRPNP